LTSIATPVTLHAGEHLDLHLDETRLENALKGYIVALVYVKPSQIIQAFSRTLKESKFLPRPATLRELSGQTMTGDATLKARTELFRIVAAMRVPRRGSWSEAARDSWPGALRHRRRKARGERPRGELRGITEVGPEAVNSCRCACQNPV
jgi:hypothetical protein